MVLRLCHTTRITAAIIGKSANDRMFWWSKLSVKIRHMNFFSSFNLKFWINFDKNLKIQIIKIEFPTSGIYLVVKTTRYLPLWFLPLQPWKKWRVFIKNWIFLLFQDFLNFLFLNSKKLTEKPESGTEPRTRALSVNRTQTGTHSLEPNPSDSYLLEWRETEPKKTRFIWVLSEKCQNSQYSEEKSTVTPNSPESGLNQPWIQAWNCHEFQPWIRGEFGLRIQVFRKIRKIGQGGCPFCNFINKTPPVCLFSP
jgi:hypothetical protein